MVHTHAHDVPSPGQCLSPFLIPTRLQKCSHLGALGSHLEPVQPSLASPSSELLGSSAENLLRRQKPQVSPGPSTQAQGQCWSQDFGTDCSNLYIGFAFLNCYPRASSFLILKPIFSPVPTANPLLEEWVSGWGRSRERKMIGSKTCPGPSSVVTIVYPQVFPSLFFGLAPGLEGSPAWTKLESERAESFEESRRGGGELGYKLLSSLPKRFPMSVHSEQRSHLGYFEKHPYFNIRRLGFQKSRFMSLER